jgi:hypothetical protein
VLLLLLLLLCTPVSAAQSSCGGGNSTKVKQCWHCVQSYANVSAGQSSCGGGQGTTQTMLKMCSISLNMQLLRVLLLFTFCSVTPLQSSYGGV